MSLRSSSVACRLAGVVPILAVGPVLLSSAACGTGEARTAAWRGGIDTLETGRVVVTNPAEGVWDSATTWRIVEEVRIGAADGAGPDMFGRISTFDVGPTGEFYVLEGQAQELRVFGRTGAHVRTIGRKGGGPGEFQEVVGLAWAPDGNLWVIDPSNARISVFDTAGNYLTNHRALGGMIIFPWPGGFDEEGWFYNYAPNPNVQGYETVLVRYDDQLEPVDTIWPPRDEDVAFFESPTETGGWMRAGVPFRPGLVWRLSPTGHIWFALTGTYQLFQSTLQGDTLRVISREFTPLPVTAEDVDSAVARLEWFTRQGGKIDLSRFPGVQPALRTFYLDDEGNIWVLPRTREGLSGHVLEVFDPQGRFLGSVRVPVALSPYPPPIFRNGMIYGVTLDELEVPYLFRARIIKP